MKNKLASLIYPAHRFWENSPEEAVYLAREGVGGFCFYGGGKDEIVQLIAELKEINPDILICADYENGTGQWVKEGSVLPTNLAIGASHDVTLAYKKAKITALEAKALGVDWVLSPVCDLADTPLNPIVNTRAFSQYKDIASVMAAVYLKGLKSEGILSSVKHFPGHGATNKDSHLELPVLNRSLEELLSNELVPFADNLPAADSVMVGHFLIESLDDKYPTSCSFGVINGVLRDYYGYKGLIVSDALSMKAIGDENSAAALALNAGVDILLVPNKPKELLSFLTQAYNKSIISDEVINRALLNQKNMKAKISYDKKPPLSVVGAPEHIKLNEITASRCCCFIKEVEEPVLKSGDTVNLIIFGKAPDENISALKADLKGLGINFSNGKNTQKLIFSYHAPKAMSGQIDLTDDEKSLLSSCEDNSVIMAALGSPFVFNGFTGKVKAGLCAFDNNIWFQKAALQILTGKISVKGSMPVTVE